MMEKLKKYVSSLTDQEIDTQLKDFFDWARVYKELLEAEQKNRRSCCVDQNVSLTENDTFIETYKESDDDLNYKSGDDEIGDAFVEYELAQIIQQKVSGLSVDETRELLNRLNQISANNLNLNDLSQLQYEIEACEIHLFELTGEILNGKNICPSCGEELDLNSKFCGKCGKAISRD